MKLQSLAIIFIIIIMPITMVFSEYVNNLIKTQENELSYDTKLLNSTYDAIKAYQLNTVNNAFGDVTNKKIQDLEAAAKTFYNALSSNFGYTGYRSEVMKEYVPALVFTLYDGFYTYSLYNNTITNVKNGKDYPESHGYAPSYSTDGSLQEGLKPFVYYTCRYVNDAKNYDFSISYTLDNYITIQGMINNEYVYDNGYLYSVGTGAGKLQKVDDITYKYEDVEFKKSDTEELKEYVPDTNSGEADGYVKEYSYAKINGKKYYLHEGYYGGSSSYIHDTILGEDIDKNAGIFFIDENGERNYSQAMYKDDDATSTNEFLKYYRAIKKNKSAYEYYKRAYEFSKMVLTSSAISGYKDKAGTEHSRAYNLAGKEIQASNAVFYSDRNPNYTSLKSYGDIKIFSTDDIHDERIEDSSSPFNQHRKAVIRYVIETTLSSAIASYSSSAQNSNFVMPKISETDWEIIQEDVCAISFLQGMSIGSKKYNGYAVVANTLTKEYVGENDIYIIRNDDIYCRVNDGTIASGNVNGKDSKGYYQGAWKIDFEQKQGRLIYTDKEKSIFYYPIKGEGSYSSIMGSFDRNSIETTNMRNYLKTVSNTNLKEAYYKALARERWGAYNVNNVNYELYDYSNENEYFLKDYTS